MSYEEKSVEDLSSQNLEKQQRLLTPDFARGIALLGIAIANGLTAWATSPDSSAPGATTSGLIVDGSMVDKTAVIFSAMFAHVRGLPMFATLLGYGIGMIMIRQLNKGYSVRETRGQLLRRYGALVAFGAVHTVFLFWGDIMFTYGLIALVVIFMMALSDKTLVRIAVIVWAVSLPLIALSFGFFGLGDGMQVADGLITDSSTYFQGQLKPGFLQLLFGIFGAVLVVPMIGPLIIIGFIAGRRGMLANPEPYERFLKPCMWVTAAIIMGIGLPLGLSQAGFIPGVSWWWALNNTVGFLSGPGFVVAAMYICRFLARNNWQSAWPVTMITRLGAMSMTGYILQSVLFGIFVANYGLGIGFDAGAAMVTGVSALVWVGTLVFANLWAFRAKRGPFEIAHRALGYGRPLPPAAQPDRMQASQALVNPPTQPPADGTQGSTARTMPPHSAGDREGFSQPHMQPGAYPGYPPEESTH